VGVAAFGALFTSRITELLPDAAGLHITPEAMRRMSPAARAATQDAFADAITRVFAVAVPLLLIGFVLAILLRELPLRTGSGAVIRATSALEVDFAEESLVAVADPALALESVAEPAPVETSKSP
jgi:hypothetical protein